MTDDALVLCGSFFSQSSQEDKARIHVTRNVGQKLGHQVPRRVGTDADEYALRARSGRSLPFRMEAPFQDRRRRGSQKFRKVKDAIS